MSWWKNLNMGIRALRRKSEHSREMDEELEGFVQASAADKVRSGLSPEAALRAARIEMGSAETVKENVRAAGWESVVENVWRDIRHGLRALRKSPGFTAVAVLSLALGIGANTAVFTLVNQLMLRSLPVRNPQQLVAFGRQFGGGIVELAGSSPSPVDIFPYHFYQELTSAKQPYFQGICAYSSFSGVVSVKQGGPAGQARAMLVSGNFFHVLEASPLLGHVMTAADTAAPGGKAVAVVSYRYWQRTMGGDPAAIGRTITINHTLFTVIGVMPPTFFGVSLGPRSTDLWLPVTLQPEVMLQPSLLGPKSLYWMHIMARRQPGANLQQAQAWVSTQLQQMMADREGPRISPARARQLRQFTVQLLPGARGISGMRARYEAPLIILMGVVVLVLLIACANLANFLLARASMRERELATRLALGSSRARIVRQVLTEALLLSAAGGLLGLALAWWGTRRLIQFVIGGATHTPLKATPDLHVLAFTFGISLLTGLLFGLAPALRASRVTVAPMLQAGSRNSSGAGASRLLPKLLVTAQVMLSVILLAGTGLFLRTLQNLERQNLGFQRHHLLQVVFNAKFAGYKSGQMNALYTSMIERMSALPGVESATLSGAPPISPGNWGSPITVVGKPHFAQEDRGTLLNRVGPGYFRTIGIAVLQGRVIGRQDTASSLKVAVVNQTMAHLFFPKGDAIGQSFTVGDPSVHGVFQIVGIVRDAKYNSPAEKPQPMTYLPVEQLTGDDAYAYFLQLRTAGDAAAITGEVRHALAEIDPNIPILEVRTVDQLVDDSMANQRMIAQLSSVFSLLALLLACMGLYGVMTYSVVRRTSEIGIRLALGAQTGRVLAMVMNETLRLLAVGIAIGIPAALLLTRLVRSQLFEVKADDPLTLAGAVAAIAAVTLVAAWLPARRAARVDPMVALRCE